MTALNVAHQDLILATHRGFTFLLANGIGWLIAGILAHYWPIQRTATLLLVMGAVTTPLAFARQPVKSPGAATCLYACT